MNTQFSFLFCLLVTLLITSCESGADPALSESPPIQSERFFNLITEELYKTTSYFYNPEGKLIQKIEKFEIDIPADNRTEYSYDSEGNLIKMLVYQTGWTEDLTSKEKVQTTSYSYQNGLLFKEKTYRDTLQYGYSQQTHFYSDGKLALTEHLQYSAHNNTKRIFEIHYRYDGSKLIEKEFSQNGEKWGITKYEYQDGLLTKEYNDYDSTTHTYSGNKIVRSITYSGDFLMIDLTYHYSKGLLSEKRSKLFTVYSNDPSEPYFIEQTLIEY